MTRFFAATASFALALGACSNDADVTDVENPDSEGEAIAMAEGLEAGDFMDLGLGAKVVGPEGPEPKTVFSTAEGNFADMTSYVACPEGMDACDPAAAPEGTVYTYVHTIYPGEDNDPTTGSGDGNDSSDVERAEVFRITRPAHGFTGEAGFSKAEALAAIGPKADVVITCDNGALVWTVSAGDGGNQWEQAEPLTFYWKSTVPPAGPQDAYQLTVNYTDATAKGPFPGEAAGATNARLADTNNPSTAG